MHARYFLLRRISIEGRAYAAADRTTKQIRWGRVLAYLDVGVAFGLWSERAAGRAADLIEHGQSLRRLARVLRPIRSASRRVGEQSDVP
jgi:hypothetical protein